MGITRVRRAMNAGKRWAEKQLNNGIEITPSSIEQAAREQYSHVRFRHLFMTSALEVVQQAESQVEPQLQNRLL